MRTLTLFLVLIFVSALGGVTWKAIHFLYVPPSSVDNTQIIFDVPPNTSFQKVSESLVEKELLQDTVLFKILAKATRSTGRILVGEYALNKTMTPMDILKVLTSGKSIQHSLTFPEGMNMYEMAQLVEDKGLGSKEEFLKHSKDKDLIKELLDSEHESLEGYLFPETYLVTKFTGPKKLIQLMVTKFKEAYEEIKTDSKLNMPMHETVTLASIIEKETGAPEERPMISSVFHNRLKKKMRLQSDPTIIYGIMDLNGGLPVQNINKKDILTSTRYNTYRVAALPFGPIANPGKEALKAALNPADSPFLYFVSQNNGTHVFSETYEKHDAAVKKYQLDKRMREGRSWRDLNK